MAKVKDKDLQLGDVVEFTPNGEHIKLVGEVFENQFGSLSIRCDIGVVGLAANDGRTNSRNYKLLSRIENDK